GYRIPKDSTVLMNVWALHHDPDFYDEPEKFDPERFMRNPVWVKTPTGVYGQLEVESGRKAVYTFGAGRRACPGEQFAMNSIVLAFTQLLWAYDIVSDGQFDIGVATGFTTSLTVAPRPFKV
ncbi:cytochrome P450, partial [Thozetella sp. PMI_491]